MTNITKFSLETIHGVFRSGAFDSIEYMFPTDSTIFEDIYAHGRLLRKKIHDEFSHSNGDMDKRDYYAIGMAYWWYSLCPEAFFRATTWDLFNDQFMPMVTEELTVETKLDLLDRNDASCLCSQHILKIDLVSFEGTFTILGSTCIEKSSIKSLKASLRKITHYECGLCNKTYKRKNRQQSMCGTCDNTEQRQSKIAETNRLRNIERERQEKLWIEQRAVIKQEQLRKDNEERERERQDYHEKERFRREWEETDRLRKETEEIERVRKETEKSERLRREWEESERLRKERMERERLLKIEKDKQDQIRSEQLAVERKRKDLELRRKKQKEIDDLERLRKSQNPKLMATTKPCPMCIGIRIPKDMSKCLKCMVNKSKCI